MSLCQSLKTENYGKLEPYNRHQKNTYNIGTGFGHFAFSVDSLDAFTAKIAKLGYDYLYPPFDLNGKGSKIAFINDPDGYEIELIEKVEW